MKCTRHRVFLAVLICAAKYLNDSSPKNMHWTKYGRFFSSAEVNLMEKQLLYLLDYNLRVTEEDLCAQLEPFWHSSPVSVSTPTIATPPSLLALRRASEQQQQEPVSPSTTPLKVGIRMLRKSSFNPPCDSPESPLAGASGRWTSRYGNNLDVAASPAYPPMLAAASSSRRPSTLSVTTPSSYFHNLHLEAPVPGLARRDSTDSQLSIASSLDDFQGTLVSSASNGQLSVTAPGMPRKASYTARPGHILLVKPDEEPPLSSPTSHGPGLLKKLAQRHTPLRSVRKAGFI